MKKTLTSQVKHYLADHTRRKRLGAVAGALSLCTAVGVFSALTMPAISMEKSNPLLQADGTTAQFGETLTARVTATAKTTADETVCYLAADELNAALALDFDGDAAQITTDAGDPLTLTRTQNGDAVTGYWFTLQNGQSVTFELPYTSVQIEQTVEPDNQATPETAAQPEQEQEPQQVQEPVTLAQPDANQATPETADAPQPTQAPVEPEQPVETVEQQPAAPQTVLVNPEAAQVTLTAADGATLDDARDNVTLAQATAETAQRGKTLTLAWADDVQTLTAQIYTDETLATLADDAATITVRGRLPQGTTAKAYPVQTELEGKTVLASYDISLYLADGSLYEPEQGTVAVSILLPDLAEPAEGVERSVYYVPEDGAPEDMGATQTDTGLTFEAEHFSIYTVAEDVAVAEEDAATYGAQPAIDTVKIASDTVWMNLFDYDEKATSDENNDINKGHSFRFVTDEIKGADKLEHSSYNSAVGINGYVKRDISGNHYYALQGVVAPTLVNGYPQLKKPSDALWQSESLAYLFNDSAVGGKTAYMGVDKLFTKGSDGYFRYNSDENFAQFNTEGENENLFTVYGGKQDGFFPFNTYDGSTHSNDPGSYYNHLFGLSMGAQFAMPKGGRINGEAMVFRFSGDDDMWVYLDDVLVLDIGGIHGAASGSIDFAAGTTTVDHYMTIGDSNRYGAKTTSISELFKAAGKEYDGTDNSTHTLTFFYLERGNWASNCEIEFNLPVKTQEEITNGTRDIDVTKKWSDGADKHTNDKVTVKLFANGQATDKTMTLSAANNWSGTFNNVQRYQTGTTTEIAYTVEEVAVNGYTSTIKQTTTTTPAVTNTIWVPVNSVESGKNYVLFYDNDQALTNASSSTLSGTAVTKVNKQVTIGEETYSNYLTGVNPNQIWKITLGNRSKYYFQNQHTERYLGYGNSKFSTKSSNENWEYFDVDSGKIYEGTSEYLKAPSSSVSKDKATSFTLYKEVQQEVTPEQTEIAFTITNAKNSGSGADPSMAHNKTIDYLGDNGSNPDTILTGSDLYRLYLDISGQANPIDVLFIVDRSGSMQDNGKDDAVVDLLTGTNTQKSLIREIAAWNSENNVAVTWFAGNENNSSNDSGISQYWEKATSVATNLNKFKSDSSSLYGKSNNGTNYTAGFWKALDVLNADTEIQDNGHQKVVIFLSDGKPTFYFGPENGVAGTYQQYKGGSIKLNRHGTGSSNNVSETTPAAEDFIAELNSINGYGDARLYSITYGDSADDAKELLNLLSPSSGNKSFASANAASLTETMKAILDATKISNVVITDTLSEYVDINDASKADWKVTQTEKGVTNPTVKTLYENNGITRDGQGIVESVAYDVATKKITVTFVPGFTMDNSYTYTLSYNVKVTDKAYENFASTGYGNTTGDQGTDYGNNTTSSGNPGFHSNNKAEVSYVVNGADKTEQYPHPVVQVQTATLNLLKKGNTTGNPVLWKVEFALYNADANWQQGTPVKTITTNAEGKATITGLRNGNYLLVETKAASGYDLPTAPWKITVNGQTITVTDQDDDAVNPSSDVVYTIYNHAGYELPSTGGAGTIGYTVGGLGLMVTAAALCIYNKRRKGDNTL